MPRRHAALCTAAAIALLPAATLAQSPGPAIPGPATPEPAPPPGAAAAPPSIVGWLAQSSGTVWVAQGSGQPWQAAIPNQPLSPGEAIAT
ncbi:MAG TPA: hypothetical protein VMA86_03665, partial [Acetobacteraceae bacterium]|nr:hypothetical protein [Acetobacteraceae bacterium]